MATLSTVRGIFSSPESNIAGCDHLGNAKNAAKEGREDMVKNFGLLVRWALKVEVGLGRKKDETNVVMNGKKRREEQRNETPLPVCATCQTATGRLHACMHCAFVGCWKDGHMRKHLEESKEKCVFAMDFTHHQVYCFDCEDYIYDLDLDHTFRLENMRHIYSFRSDPAEPKRPRYTEWHPTSEELAIIRENASQVAYCRGIRGLYNFGNTCFMNAILQSLAHNPLLRQWYLSDHHSYSKCQANRKSTSHPSKSCLSCEMDKLFAQLYSGVREPYGPTSFLHAMWTSSKELAGYAQQDAHEFFISALNVLHANESGEVGKDIGCQCIIHKTFSGVLRSDVTCLKCGNVTTAFDPMLDVSLDLKKEEKAKGGNGTNGFLEDLNENGVERTDEANGSGDGKKKKKEVNTLIDCLNRYTLSEKLGPKEYSCSKCGNFQEATKQLSIQKLPPVLAFQLKLFEHASSSGASTQKIESKIRFPLDLDMAPYISTKRKGSTSTPPRNSGVNFFYLYTLFAVVNHYGKMDSGHYTMFAKHRGEWFKFDDSNVTVVEQKNVLDSKAYMCFYVKKSLDYDFPCDEKMDESD